MPRIAVIRRTLARAASLLAVFALVIALFQSGPAAMAALGMTEVPSAEHAAHAVEDCAHHAAQHEAQFHHPHAALVTAHADVDQDAGYSHDHAHHHHTHPCCMSVASIVLPVLAIMQLPVPAGGHRVMWDAAERLEKHAPEGPTEPPRTADMS